MPEQTIVAQLPSASQNLRKEFLVMDSVAPGDCTIGGGTARTVCVSNGTGWVPAESVASALTNQIQVEIDFGPDENSIARVFVPAPWVSANSIIDCDPASLATDDHDMDDVVVENLSAYATKLQPGVGFNLVAFAPNRTWGRYLINILGR